MARIEAAVDCPVFDSFRVQQVAGMFDVSLAERAGERFEVELPDLSDDWQVGAIVGPSGSGKSTIAREAYGKRLVGTPRWPKNRAIVDAIAPDAFGMKQITAMLTSVGFSSPPAWVKPYGVLSNGERFRCDLARALLTGGDLVVFDEFTSVVDRTVAQVGSAAVAKCVRRTWQPESERSPQRFVAVTCHYDVLDWLECDWVLDMASCQLARSRLRRPRIRLELHRCERSLWGVFKRAHYLTGSLSTTSVCYVALWTGRPCCFVAVTNHFGKVRGNTKIKRISRIVTLPDFQGVGIGGRVLDAVAQLHRQQGARVVITTGHPSMIALLKRKSSWRITRVNPTGSAARRVDPTRAHAYGDGDWRKSSSQGRAVISAEYLGG